LQEPHEAIEKIQSESNFDLSFGYFNNKTIPAIELDAILKNNPELKSLAHGWSYEQMGAWASITRLREGGIAIIGASENWISSEKSEKFRKALFSHGTLLQVLDLSECKFKISNKNSSSKETIPTHPYLYIFRKDTIPENIGKLRTKVIKAKGEFSDPLQFKELLRAITAHQTQVSTPGQFFNFGPDEQHPFQIDIFFAETTRGEIPGGSQLLLRDPEQYNILRKLSQSTVRLGSMAHISFLKDDHYNEALTKKTICAVIPKGGKQKLPEFWPSTLAKGCASKIRRYHIIPQNPNLGSIHFMLALLNSKIIHYWLLSNGASVSGTPLSTGDFKLIPYPQFNFIQDVPPELAHIMNHFKRSSLETVEPIISDILKEGSSNHLYHLTCVLQEEWNRSLILLNKYRELYWKFPIISYCKLDHQKPKIRYSKILEKIPQTMTTIGDHPDLEVISKPNSLQYFQIASLEFEKSNSHTGVTQGQGKGKITFESARGEAIILKLPQPLLEILKEKTGNMEKNLYWNEFNALYILPKDYRALEYIASDIQKTSSTILDQMLKARHWIEEALLRLYWPHEDNDLLRNSIDSCLKENGYCDL